MTLIWLKLKYNILFFIIVISLYDYFFSFFFFKYVCLNKSYILNDKFC